MPEERVAAGGVVSRDGPPTRSWLRLALPVAGCVLLVSMTAHVRVPLLPELGRDLAMPASQLGVAVTLFGLGRLAMDLPAGGFADRFRPMRVMGVAALVMSLGSGMVALAPGAAVVMVAFLLLGAASATANTTGMTSLTGTAPAQRRGSAMAMYSGCLLTGQALGPALSGGIAGLTGWRVAAASGAALAGVVAAVALSWRSTAAPAPSGGRRTPASGPPLTPVQRGVAYGIGFSVFLTVGAVAQTLVPLIGAGELSLDVSLIGAAIGLGGAARVVSAVATGAVSDAVSRRAALIPCLVLQVVGVGLLAVDGGATWWLVAVVLLSLGASAHSVAATVLVDRGDPSHLGRVLGRYRFTADIGLVVGPVVTATLYESAGRGVAAGVIAATLLISTLAAVVLLPETGVRPAERVGTTP